jgi:hypothetical protein
MMGWMVACSRLPACLCSLDCGGEEEVASSCLVSTLSQPATIATAMVVVVATVRLICYHEALNYRAYSGGGDAVARARQT